MGLLNRMTLGVLALAACGPNRTYPDRNAYVAAQTPALECVPNLDGRIDAAEVKTAFDVPVHYLVNPAGTSRGVELVGSIDGQSRRVWDFATDYADDRVATLSAQHLTGKWYANSFPTGQFVSTLDLGGLTEGVYENRGGDLLLLGYASPTAAPSTGKTLVVYSQPIAVFRYPLEPGKEWVSISDVRNAFVRGLPYAGRDTYQVRVEAAGQLDLPDLSFTQAMRVRTHVTIEPSVGQSIQRRQSGWVFECFGEVARATAADNEVNDDFTQAVEVRRLGF